MEIIVIFVNDVFGNLTTDSEPELWGSERLVKAVSLKATQKISVSCRQLVEYAPFQLVGMHI